MQFTIREATAKDYDAIGTLTVSVYKALPDMPAEHEMPDYYAMLADTKQRLTHPSVTLIAAFDDAQQLVGSVTYYDDMAHYGSGGTAPQETHACGMRLLAVSPATRGQSLGRQLTEHCLALAQQRNHTQMILHTTNSMKPAWKLYEGMGFQRSPSLDFMQGPLPVFGFRKHL